jgi:hypothetical protein
LLLVLPLHILLDNVCMHGTNVAVIECLGMRTTLNHKSALKLALIIRMCLRLRAHIIKTAVELFTSLCGMHAPFHTFGQLSEHTRP